MSCNAIKVIDLCIDSDRTAKAKRLVSNLEFSLEPGQVLALLGASGAGKSLSAFALAGLLAKPCWVSRGKILLNNMEIDPNCPRTWRKHRGKDVFLVFQSPGSAFNPTLPIGSQITEAMADNLGLSSKQAQIMSLKLLHKVGLGPKEYAAYAWQLSGGMRQRCLLAIALGLKPKVLVADEPTTGLDAMNKAEILKLMQYLKERHNTAIVLISHDLAMISIMADKFAFMNQGRVLKNSEIPLILQKPKIHEKQLLVKTLSEMIKLNA